MAANTYNSSKLSTFFYPIRINRAMAFGAIIVTALVAFEIFNYGTTEYALTDLLGDLRFLSIRWATILSVAFCGIDFAGLARLFTPEQGGRRETHEAWYLFGAWMLAATMNAMLTWWGVSLAILNNQPLGNEVIARGTLLRIVPIFVAVLIWLIRVLIIGTISASGERLFQAQEERPKSHSQPASYYQTASQPQPRTNYVPHNISSLPRAAASTATSRRPVASQNPPPEPEYAPTELSYHPVSMSASSRTNVGYPKPSKDHFS